jgi:hypothetical protein
MTDAAFYCVADDRYFLGAVGVLNSLRLQGHREPLFVLDCGLTARQRELLGPHASVVPGDPGTPPWLSKTIAPVREPAGVMVLIDTDMIVTRPLAGLIGDVARGGVAAFENDRPRFVPEWSELLDLGPATPMPYVSSGLVLLGGSQGAEVLALLDDRQRRVDIERTMFGAGEDAYPFRYPEQDVLNAILCTRPEGFAVTRLPNRLAPNPPFAGLRLLDRGAVRCGYGDGTEPYVLHHFHRKPWIDRIYYGLYSRLLSRLLLADDLALRVPDELIPLRLRAGALARLERSRVDVTDVFRRYALRRDV